MMGIPTETTLLLILACMATVVIGAVAIGLVIKKRLKADESESQGLPSPTEISEAMNLPEETRPPSIPEAPSDALMQHLEIISIENRARDEALRIACELGYTCETHSTSTTAQAGADSENGHGHQLWILVGPGPLGAVALAIVRHLDSLGFPATPQLLQYPDRLGPQARTQLKTLTSARLPVIEQPSPRPLDGISGLISGVERDLLPLSRQQDLEAISQAAAEEGMAVDELEAFEASYQSPAPLLEDPVMPVPEQILSREEVRLLDSLAQDHYGMEGAALMENAGYWAAREAFLIAASLAENEEEDSGSEPAAVTVLCGRGNNGGDGFVIARHLLHWGLQPRVFLLGEKERVTDDSGSNMRLLEAEGVKVTPLFDESQWPMLEQTLAASKLIIDALLGTGMTGNVRGPAVKVIQMINAAHEKGSWVLAVDGPSGLDCNTGEPLGSVVTADVTVTFAANKMGFERGQGPKHCGKIVRADIGLPREIYRRRMKNEA